MNREASHRATRGRRAAPSPRAPWGGARSALRGMYVDRRTVHALSQLQDHLPRYAAAAPAQVGTGALRTLPHGVRRQRAPASLAPQQRNESDAEEDQGPLTVTLRSGACARPVDESSQSPAMHAASTQHSVSPAIKPADDERGVGEPLRLGQAARAQAQLVARGRRGGARVRARGTGCLAFPRCDLRAFPGDARGARARLRVRGLRDPAAARCRRAVDRGLRPAGRRGRIAAS